MAQTPHTHVIALKPYDSFNNLPFDKQLTQIEHHINNICEKLINTKDPTDEWIIAWPEYGLTDGSIRCITSAQKKALKKKMEELTKTYPKLTIVSGTVATTQIVDKRDFERWKKKVDGIKSAYEINKDPYALVMRTDKEEKVLSYDNFYLIRNTAYVFSNINAKGTCIARHDKITPADEPGLLNKSIFRPGKGRSREAVINPKLGIEICLEHNEGILQKMSSKKYVPLIQLILSNTTICDPQQCVSPYVIQVDKEEPPLLLTDIKEDLEIIASSYDMYVENLVPTKPKTIKDYTFENFPHNIKESGVDFTNPLSFFEMENFKSLLLNNRKQQILDVSQYLSLIRLYFSKYHVTWTRNFASALLDLMTKYTSEDPEHTTFQQYLTTLIKMDNTAFTTEITKGSHNKEKMMVI